MSLTKPKLAARLQTKLGLNKNELLWLLWGDVDWEGCQVEIQRTFNNWHLFTHKTLRSCRYVLRSHPGMVLQ
jgi:hypothetical protein